MLTRIIAFLAVSTTAAHVGAAPVLVTKDNYQSAADSPFDLSNGYLEDFDDGVVNTPGLSTSAVYHFVAGGIGGGKAIEPTSFVQLLDGRTNLAGISFFFDAPYPTQVGFVMTQAAFPGDVGITILPVDLTPLEATFAPNRFFGVTDPDGIEAISIVMAAPVPGEPFFQIDHLQYVPEPSGAVLLAIGVAALLILGRGP